MRETPASDIAGDEPAQSSWQVVITEAAAIADEYRNRGWRVCELHPGDSVLVDSERRTGLDVLLPESEYEALEEVTQNATFTDVDVFRAMRGSVCYLLIVETDPDSETVVIVPAYYDPGSSRKTRENIRSDGKFRLFCRRLNDDYVEFVHDDVGPFLPE